MSDSPSLFPNDGAGGGSRRRAPSSGSIVTRNAAVPVAPAFGVRVRDAATNTYSEHIVDIVTGPLGFTVIHARVSVEDTIPLELPTGTENDDIIHKSDAAERNGGIVSIDVTDETQFFIGPHGNPIRLYGDDGVEAAREFLARGEPAVPPPPL